MRPFGVKTNRLIARDQVAGGRTGQNHDGRNDFEQRAGLARGRLEWPSEEQRKKMSNSPIRWVGGEEGKVHSSRAWGTNNYSRSD